MATSCFVCVIRPLVYFTYFSYGFVDIQCPHVTPAVDRASIRQDAKRWCFTLLLLSTLFAIGTLTLYLNLTNEKKDYFSILTTAELVFVLLGLIRLFRDNILWKERLKELQLMMCIWNYIGTFRPERYHVFLNPRVSKSLIIFILILFAVAVPYFFIDEITLLTYLNLAVRFWLGVIVTSTYLYSLYEFAIYHLFFKWTFEQIQTEIECKLVASSKLMVIFDVSKISTRSSFITRLRKLRQLYMVIIYSFRRMKKIRRSYLLTVILVYHVLLILIFFLTFIMIKGGMEFHVAHYLYVAKDFAYTFDLANTLYLCDDMQTLLQRMRTVMFKIPLNILTPEEAREIEVFTKLLSWEQPTDAMRDLPVFRMNLLLNLVVDVITNTMVVIQLYLSFSKQV